MLIDQEISLLFISLSLCGEGSRSVNGVLTAGHITDQRRLCLVVRSALSESWEAIPRHDEDRLRIRPLDSSSSLV